MASGYGFDESTKAAFAAMASHVNALVSNQNSTDTTTPITQRLDDIINLIAQKAGISQSATTCSAATSTILSTLNNLNIAKPSAETLDIQHALTKWCEDSANKGFPDAKLPALTPLLMKGDYNGETEGELRDLAVKMFRTSLSSRAFDANVLGAAQLGSTDLVRFALAKDGLALANSAISHQSMRYLYKAWMSRNTQGRGLHFLRTYLQLQFGSYAKTHQLWQNNNLPYPSALKKNNPGNAFLTSIVSVEIEDEALKSGDAGRTLETIASVLPSVLPARLIPAMYAKARASTSALAVSVSASTRSNESRNPNYPCHVAKIKTSALQSQATSKDRFYESQCAVYPDFRNTAKAITIRLATAHTRLKEAA